MAAEFHTYYVMTNLYIRRFLISLAESECHTNNISSSIIGT